MAGCRTGGLSSLGGRRAIFKMEQRCVGDQKVGLTVIDDFGLSVITGRRVRKRRRLCNV
jgi:hypothetical protein